MEALMFLPLFLKNSTTMPITRKLFKNALEQAINENGFTIVFEGNDEYYIIQKDVESESISMQLILPSKVEISKKNSDGKEIYSLNNFNLNLSMGNTTIGGSRPDYDILAIENADGCPYFIVISSRVLSRKLYDLGLTKKSKVELHFLSCTDGKIFFINDVGQEGKWSLLSKGVNGRMIDGTERDYSKCLNNWNGLKSK